VVEGEAIQNDLLKHLSFQTEWWEKIIIIVVESIISWVCVHREFLIFFLNIAPLIITTCLLKKKKKQKERVQ